MNQETDKVCGLDVHKRFVMAAIMIKVVTNPIIEQFSTDGPGIPIARLARRVQCRAGCHGKHRDLLEGHILVVANAREIHDLKGAKKD